MVCTYRMEEQVELNCGLWRMEEQVELNCGLCRMEEHVEFLLEGVLMLTTATLGLVLNITSIFYFARYHHQRTFHRSEF